MLRKYTNEWKLEELRKKGKVSVRTRNRVVRFRMRDAKMFITVGDKEYTVTNPDSTLIAVIDEKDRFEVQIGNPDETVGNVLVLNDMQIASRIW